eukprot:7877411-Ditylum_brightwellii.AAC.1
MSKVDRQIKQPFNPSLPIEPTMMHACKEWICCPDANKTWANFCVHFTNAHQYFHELQQTTMQAGHTTNNVMHEQSVHAQTTEVLA